MEILDLAIYTWLSILGALGTNIFFVFVTHKHCDRVDMGTDFKYLAKYLDKKMLWHAHGVREQTIFQKPHTHHRPIIMVFSWALCFLLLRMWKDSAESGRPDKCHSRYRKAFYNTPSSEEKALCSRKIPCISILSLPDSHWWKLLNSQVDQSITMTGFDFLMFWSLLKKFAPLFDHYTPFNKSHITLKVDTFKGGHPRIVCSEDCLGLVLVWTCTRGSMTAL